MKCIKTEEWLTKQGVSWEFKRIPLSCIDLVTSQHNQARFQAINQDWVIKLAIQAEATGDLEAVVAYRKKDEKFVLINGNHRVLALGMADIMETDVYQVLTNNEEIIERLTYAANALNGDPNSSEENLAHAYHLMVSRNLSAKTVAALLFLEVSPVHKYFLQHQAKERLDVLGFKERIDKSKLEKLNSLKLDAPLLAMAQLTFEASLSNEQVTSMVNAILARHTEKGQIDLIAIFRDQHKEEIARRARGKVTLHFSNREKLVQHMNGILRLKDEKVTSIDEYVIEKARAVITVLEALCLQSIPNTK